MKTKSQLGKMSRNKGKNFELEIVKQFKSAGFTKAARQLEFQEGLGVDLKNTGLFDVQCKRLARYASITMIEEVPLVPGRIPVLITKADNKPSMAVIPLEHFLELIRKTNETT